MSMPTALTRCAAIGLLAFALSACGSNAPAQPSLRPYTAPPSQSIAPTPIPSNRPSGMITPAPSASPASTQALSASALKSLLTSAGFLCDAPADNYRCDGTEGVSHNHYVIAIGSSDDALAAFLFDADNPAGLDTVAVSAYLGSVYNFITGTGDGQARIAAAFGTVGEHWLSGTLVMVVTDVEANKFELTGDPLASLSKQVILPDKAFASALLNQGYSCTNSKVSGAWRYECTLATAGTKDVYLDDSEGAAYQIVLTSTDIGVVKMALDLLFLPDDAGTLKSWLDSSGAATQLPFGNYQLNLTSAGGHTLTITMVK